MVGSGDLCGRICAGDFALLEWAGRNPRGPGALRSKLEKQSRQRVYDHRLADRRWNTNPGTDLRRSDLGAGLVARVETRGACSCGLPADRHLPRLVAQRLSLVFHVDCSALML